jgi:fatty-acyl-CoA synthase
MFNLPFILCQNYYEAPERTAVTLLDPRRPEEPITYRRLIQGAAGYARILEQRGVQPGEVVVLVLQHGEDLIFSFFGAILYGAIPSIMPFLTEKLSPERYQEDMRSLIRITRPAAIVTYPDFMPVVTGTLGDGDSVRLVLSSAEATPVEAPDLAGLPGLERSEDDIVLLQHSSGTTGLQKGVALAHRAVLNQLACYAEAIHMQPEDVIVSWLPLYHDMGLIAGFIMPILNRVPLVLMSPFDWVRAPYRLLQAVSKYSGTLTWLPNFAYNFCAQKIRERDLEGLDLSSWRLVINCSEPMRWESHQMFLKRFQPYGLRPEALATCYAMAENVFAVTQGGVNSAVIVDEIDQRTFITQRMAITRRISVASGVEIPVSVPVDTIKMLSAGLPISNTRVKVLEIPPIDAEEGSLRCTLPDRHVGELALQSDCMLSGYFRRDDLTQKAFYEGWYLTGDLGYMVDGEVYVVGRKKDLIIVGGKNIYPQDLEMLAYQATGVHPGRAVAFGVFNPDMGTEDVVLVAEVDSEDPDERLRLEDEIRQRVTRGSDVSLRTVYLVGPKWIIKTSSGKTARLANRDKYLVEINDQSHPTGIFD